MLRTLASVFTSVLLTVSTVSAGDLAEIGIKLGTNFTTPTGLPSGINGTEGIGFTGGVYAQVGLGGLIAVGAELVYESRQFLLQSDIAGEETIQTGAFNLPLILKIGLPLHFMLELGVEYSHFVKQPDDIVAVGQSMALLGLVWRPLDKFRIGARFQPGLSPLEIQNASDISSNVTHIYVAYVLL